MYNIFEENNKKVKERLTTFLEDVAELKTIIDSINEIDDIEDYYTLPYVLLKDKYIINYITDKYSSVEAIELSYYDTRFRFDLNSVSVLYSY